MDYQRIAEELRREINKLHGCRVEPDVTALIATAMQAAADTAREKATRFTLCDYNPRTGIGPVHVELRSPNQWAISNGSRNYNRLGEWECEPLNSSKDSAFFKRCRYTLSEAMGIAERLAAPNTPRTAQQSEAVIAKALGKNLTVVKEGE